MNTSKITSHALIALIVASVAIPLVSVLAFRGDSRPTVIPAGYRQVQNKKIAKYRYITRWSPSGQRIFIKVPTFGSFGAAAPSTLWQTFDATHGASEGIPEDALDTISDQRCSSDRAIIERYETVIQGYLRKGGCPATADSVLKCECERRLKILSNTTQKRRTFEPFGLWR